MPKIIFQPLMITNPAGRLAGIYLALRQKIYEGVPWTYDTLLAVGFSGLVICKYPAATSDVMYLAIFFV